MNLAFNLPQKGQVITTRFGLSRISHLVTFNLPQKGQVIATASIAIKSFTSSIFQPASERTGDCDGS